MKTFKQAHGFTLVEAVVVSVIIAIVGIAAVVAYSGYVKESRRQAVERIAEAAAVAASAYVRKTGNEEGLTVERLHLFLPNSSDYCIEINTDDLDGYQGSITIIDNRYEDLNATKYY